MPTSTQKGFVNLRLNDYGSRIPYGPFPATSAVITTTPEPPAKNAIKRAKPATKDLIWMGTGYSKTFAQHSFSQAVYRGNNPSFPYREWNSSEATIGRPNAMYPGQPYDPMNPLLGKINGDLANIANMLGEYKQTSKMFSLAVGRFKRSVNYARKAARKAKKGKMQGAYGALRQALMALGSGAVGATKVVAPTTRNGRLSLSNAWLQWHFGVETLMKDLYSLAEEYKATVESLPPKTARKYTKTSKRTIDGATAPYNGTAGTTNLIVSSWKRTLVAYVEIDNELLKWASDHGLINPASLVWELTTLSFVVDWFIGIGEWLEACGTPAVFSRSICYETNRKHSMQSVDFGPKWFLSSGRTLESVCRVNAVHKETSRAIRALSPAKPRWKPSASGTRIATALALLRQMSR